MTSNRGADIVFDTSGRMFAESVEATAMDGRIPIITAPPDGMASFNLRNVYRKEIRVLGVDSRRLTAVDCKAHGGDDALFRIRKIQSRTRENIPVECSHRSL